MLELLGPLIWLLATSLVRLLNLKLDAIRFQVCASDHVLKILLQK